MRAQVTRVRDAFQRLAIAHIELARTEASIIGKEVGKVAAYVAIALVLVILALTLVVLGTSLFLGEWLFGSLGWGVLHGLLLFVAIAVAAVLAALGISSVRLVGALVVGIVLGIVVGVALFLNLPNQAWTAIGDASGLAVDPAVRPLVVGTLVVGVIGLVIGLVVGARVGRAAGPAFGGAILGLLLGAALGAFSAITFGPQVAAGIGIAVAYATWIVLMAIDVSRTGVDVEALKARFYPSATIDTSKETLEWLQKRMPPGIGS